MDEKLIIGSVEWIALPSLQIPAIKVRVDSGAKTSALHAVNIKPFQKDDDTWVAFDVFPIVNDDTKVVHCQAKVIDQRMVKSSIGVSESRFVIQSTLKLNKQTWDIEITLTNRDSMGYRMLLGREAMRGKMLVDPATNFILGKVTQDKVKSLYSQLKN